MSTHPFGVEASPGSLRVTGEVDLAVAATLLDAILSVGLTGDVAEVVVDLSEVSFLDSTGMTALVEARNRLADTRVELRVADPSPFVRRVLVLGGVSEQLGLPPMAGID